MEAAHSASILYDYNEYKEVILKSKYEEEI